MESTELYEQILGIKPPWYVISVAVMDVVTAVDVCLDQAMGLSLFSCPPM